MTLSAFLLLILAIFCAQLLRAIVLSLLGLLRDWMGYREDAKHCYVTRPPLGWSAFYSYLRGLW